MTSRTSSHSAMAAPIPRPPGIAAGEHAAPNRLFMPVLVIAILNSVLTGSMVNVLLSEIRIDFDVSTARLSWVITAYSLMYAVGIPLVGRLSDFIGSRTLFTAGIAGFALGSLIAALAPSFPVLVLGRLIQGAGGAAVPALSMIMIIRVMPEDRRGAAMGLTASAVGVGSAIGPLVGGSVGDSVGWRFLFIAPVITAAVVILLSRHALPNSRVTDERRFDAIGGVLLTIASGLSLFGLTRGQSDGYTSFVPSMSFLIAMIAAALFVVRIATAPYPFVPPSLFRNGPYVRMMGVGIFNMMAYMSNLVLVPLMLVEHNGLTPTDAGLALTPGAIAIAVGSRMAGKVSDRIGPRIPIIAGLGTMLAATIYLGTVAAGSDTWVVAAGVFVAGAGTSMISAPMNSAVSRLLSPQETGIGMGLSAGSAFMGGGIGAAVTGAWLDTRLEAGAPALNPFYSGNANPWSDAFLAVAVMLLISLAFALTIRTGPDR